MADRLEYYEGYEIAYYRYQRGKKIRLQIREKNGLPPIADMPLEESDAAARHTARQLIDQKLAQSGFRRSVQRLRPHSTISNHAPAGKR